MESPPRLHPIFPGTSLPGIDSDLRALSRVPIIDERSMRSTQLRMASSVQHSPAKASPPKAAGSPQSPRRAPQPRVPEEAKSPIGKLRALEDYLRTEIAPLPRDSAHRLHAFRHVFNGLIAALPAHGPLLAEVKKEYEKAIESSAAAAASFSPPRHTLQPVHPLQLPASYYEAEWRRTEHSLALKSAQV